MPRKELLQMYHTRLGSIFFKMSITACVLMIALTVLTPVLSFVVWFLMLMLGLATLGVIFLIPGYTEAFNGLGDLLNGIGLDTLMPIVVGFSAVAVVAGVLAILLMATDKRTHNKGRIIGSIVVVVLTVVAFIIISLIGGGMQ